MQKAIFRKRNNIKLNAVTLQQLSKQPLACSSIKHSQMQTFTKYKTQKNVFNVYQTEYMGK